MLPEGTIAHAYAVINRVRIRVADAQHGGTAPSVTVGFGEADRAFGEIVEQADVALLQARSEGRDRVLLPNERDAAPAPDPGPRPRPSWADGRVHLAGTS